MNREQVVMGVATLAFAALSVALWGDYLVHSQQIYDDRDAAQAQIVDLNRQMADAPDVDTLVELTADRTQAEDLYTQAERKINDMDGWNAPQWKVKNALRLAAPAVTVLFGAFTLLAVLRPLR